MSTLLILSNQQNFIFQPGLVKYYGYESDTKSVITEDGYNLTMYCIYNSTARNTNLNPVVAFHGLMGASHEFCLNYPNQSLGKCSISVGR